MNNRKEVKNMTEEAMVAGAKAIKSKIKVALIERDMTQVELSNLLNENQQVVNRAIAGDPTPKSLNIRKRIYKILDIK
ncbi:transcriptional regulator [Pediococcus ethanolidurans]|nr:transcriptional regulator [Pediococcus ethanolidurans]